MKYSNKIFLFLMVLLFIPISFAYTVVTPPPPSITTITGNVTGTITCPLNTQCTITNNGGNVTINMLNITENGISCPPGYLLYAVNISQFGVLDKVCVADLSSNIIGNMSSLNWQNGTLYSNWINGNISVLNWNNNTMIYGLINGNISVLNWNNNTLIQSWINGNMSSLNWQNSSLIQSWINGNQSISGNASWNESYAKTLFASHTDVNNNITDVNILTNSKITGNFSILNWQNGTLYSSWILGNISSLNWNNNTLIYSWITSNNSLTDTKINGNHTTIDASTDSKINQNLSILNWNNNTLIYSWITSNNSLTDIKIINNITNEFNERVDNETLIYILIQNETNYRVYNITDLQNQINAISVSFYNDTNISLLIQTVNYSVLNETYYRIANISSLNWNNNTMIYGLINGNISALNWQNGTLYGSWISGNISALNWNNNTLIDTKINGNQTLVDTKINNNITLINSDINGNVTAVNILTNTKITNNISALNWQNGTLYSSWILGNISTLNWNNNTLIQSWITSNNSLTDTKINNNISALNWNNNTLIDSKINGNQTLTDTKINSNITLINTDINGNITAVNILTDSKINNNVTLINSDINGNISKLNWQNSTLIQSWDNGNQSLVDTKLSNNISNLNWQNNSLIDTKINGNQTLVDTKINSNITLINTDINGNVTAVNTLTDSKINNNVTLINNDINGNVTAVNTLTDTKVNNNISQLNWQNASLIQSWFIGNDSLRVNKSGDNLSGQFFINDGNLTIEDGYISGQPQRGMLGNGLIFNTEISGLDSVNLTCIGLSCRYDNMVFRINQLKSNVKAVYCNISANTISASNNLHQVFYVDNTCSIKITSIDTWYNSLLNGGNVWEIGDVMCHDNSCELINGQNTEQRMMMKQRIIDYNQHNLAVLSGFTKSTQNFPNFTIDSGNYQYLMDIETATQQVIGVKHIALLVPNGSTSAWYEYDGNGLNFTSCTNGTAAVTCSPTNRWRRVFFFMVGYNGTTDTSEIHQVLAINNISYNSETTCLDTIANPITYSLPSWYVHAAVPLYAYCIRPTDTTWSPTGWIDLRTTKISSSSTTSSGVFVPYVGASSNVDLDGFNLTATYILGNGLYLTGLQIYNDSGNIQNINQTVNSLNWNNNTMIYGLINGNISVLNWNNNTLIDTKINGNQSLVDTKLNNNVTLINNDINGNQSLVDTKLNNNLTNVAKLNENNTFTGISNSFVNLNATGTGLFGDQGGVYLYGMGGAATVGFNSIGYAAGVTGYGALMQSVPSTGLFTMFTESNVAAGLQHSHTQTLSWDGTGFITIYQGLNVTGTIYQNGIGILSLFNSDINGNITAVNTLTDTKINNNLSLLNWQNGTLYSSWINGNISILNWNNNTLIQTWISNNASQTDSKINNNLSLLNWQNGTLYSSWVSGNVSLLNGDINANYTAQSSLTDSKISLNKTLIDTDINGNHTAIDASTDSKVNGNISALSWQNSTLYSSWVSGNVSLLNGDINGNITAVNTLTDTKIVNNITIENSKINGNQTLVDTKLNNNITLLNADINGNYTAGNTLDDTKMNGNITLIQSWDTGNMTLTDTKINNNQSLQLNLAGGTMTGNISTPNASFRVGAVLANGNFSGFCINASGNHVEGSGFNLTLVGC